MKSYSFIESNLQLCSFWSVKIGLPGKRNLLWLCTSISMLSLISSLALFVARNFTEAFHARVCFASFKSRYFRTGLRTEGCFCKDVFRCRFLFALSPCKQICWFEQEWESCISEPLIHKMHLSLWTYMGRGSNLEPWYTESLHRMNSSVNNLKCGNLWVLFKRKFTAP